MHQRTARLLLLLPVALLATTALTGCSQVSNALHRTHEQSFPDRAAAQEGWTGVASPGWLPADATDIRGLATDDETNSVVALTSPSDLPAGCVAADRRGIPFESPDWAPALDAFPDRVERCGDYEVMRTEDGWFGWFTATRAGQVPSPETR